MRTRRAFLPALFILLIQLTLPAVLRAEDKLPAQLSDEEFWKLSNELSEPDGTFRSDNLLSNESYFQFVIPHLLELLKTGNVYMGVGPEQNFTYIAALKPKMVFLVDIRRGNFDLQLMYKALFEMSADRADFVSKLFSKKRPRASTATRRPPKSSRRFAASRRAKRCSRKTSKPSTICAMERSCGSCQNCGCGLSTCMPSTCRADISMRRPAR